MPKFRRNTLWRGILRTNEFGANDNDIQFTPNRWSAEKFLAAQVADAIEEERFSDACLL
jgi:hypothetical protein